MPENLKALRNRIRSIGKTKKITRAMEMVSAAKLRKSEGVMKSTRPFLHKIQELLGRLALSTGAQEHPLFQRPSTGYPVVLLFTSDKGLCGAFNAHLIKRAVKELEKDPDLRVIAVGRKGNDFLKRHYPGRIEASHVDLGGQLDGAWTDAMANNLQERFRAGEYSRIELIYPHFISTAANRPVMERYLPLEPAAFGVSEEEASEPIDYILEPTPERVFEALLPRFLQTKIYLTMAETFTSEHASRMMAMNNATKNCEELGSSLTLRLNKARQAAITTEIIEIVSGAEAL